MIIDTTQTKISVRKEAEEVFDFLLTILYAGQIPTRAMFEERGWDYDKWVIKMTPMVTNPVEYNTCSHF